VAPGQDTVNAGRGRVGTGQAERGRLRWIPWMSIGVRMAVPDDGERRARAMRVGPRSPRLPIHRLPPTTGARQLGSTDDQASCEGHDLERLIWPGTGSGVSTGLLQNFAAENTG